MTLLPGDVIACGTSLGVGAIKDGSTVAITIDGIGTLVNALAPARDIQAPHASRTIVAGETPSFTAARHE